MEDVQDIPTFEARERLTLKDAVRLSGMSEKTLRRKLEAGLLTGQRETLDYGGFMWMIDARSLADLYPDSAAVRDYVTYLESSLQSNPRPAAPPTRPEETVPTLSSQVDEVEDEPVTPAKNDFVLYLLEENRNLKEDLRDRERQLRNLQDRALNLERECGEQRGTASTQARVLEWFQRQPLAMLPAPSEGSETPAPTPQPVSTPTGVTLSRTTLTVVTSLVSLLVLLLAVKAF
ncbi:hypothetical protein ABS71_02360 [bacterium SCN 62-11]|nr:hypothetical protein [Candidatus Eremiobacteraeota bacterium]ODT77848.1 MAG: hypothetical protein ABS71_02360 [bacterium SCN 62-11]